MCLSAGLSCEPGGSAFLLKERQTSVQETRSCHQRVDGAAGCKDKHKPTTFTDVCKCYSCKIHIGLRHFGAFMLLFKNMLPHDSVSEQEPVTCFLVPQTHFITFFS